MDTPPIYLLDQAAHPIGPFTQAQLLASLRRSEIQRGDAAWQPGLSKWQPLEDILFKHYRGIDRIAGAGLALVIVGYFIISYFVLRELKISPSILLDQMNRAGTPKLDDLYIWVGVNGVGCLLAGIYLLPRLAHAGLSRWWALVGTLPVLGWLLWIPALRLPRAFRETRAAAPSADDTTLRCAPAPLAPASTPPPVPPGGVRKTRSLGHGLRRVLQWFALGSVLAASSIYAALFTVIYVGSMLYLGNRDLPPGNLIVPAERSDVRLEQSDYLKRIMDDMAARDGLDGLIARLALGQDFAKVNQRIMDMRVTNFPGSGGNWDFVLCELTLLLYNFGDDPERLYPQTVEHLVDVLLNEKGGDPLIWTPRIFGLPLPDTENHILQTESSRYLTNQWIARSGNPDPKYDNIQNGLEA